MRRILLAIAIGVVMTLASGFVPHWTIDDYEDGSEGRQGCMSGCIDAGAGYPFAYVVDGIGLSPVNSANLLMASMGDDRFLLLPYLMSLLTWSWAVWVSLCLRSLTHRRTTG